ncbi:MAG: histidine kinase dimerization/phospho-acceptor domain-containing protein [Spirulina sp.]
MEQSDRSPIAYQNRLFCRLDGLTPAEREKQRLQVLDRLGLLNSETIPIFEEAVQTAARFLGAHSDREGSTSGSSSFPQMPICFISIQVKDELWLKSALGLSQLGLRNELAIRRKLPRQQSFCQYVIDAIAPLAIDNIAENPIFASSTLFQEYGIRAYLGAPLIARSGECLGAIAVMDLVPHEFSDRDIDFLALTARWCMSEFESSIPAERSESPPLTLPWEKPRDAIAPSPSIWQNGQSPKRSPNSLKVRLLVGLTEDLRNPLTSVIGMARVLEQEIYGPLTDKQKEYLEIIHTSGQELLSRVEEMLALGVLDPYNDQLQLSPVDVEMLCQQALNTLHPLAEQQQQTLRLSIEPGNRIWLLDKDKICQALYFLCYSLIQETHGGSDIHIHICRKIEDPLYLLPVLNISLWSAHPCWHEQIPSTLSPATESGYSSQQTLALLIETLQTHKRDRKSAEEGGRETLGLLLSCHFVEMHGGRIAVEKSRQGGYRYVFKIPQIEQGDRVTVIG